MSNIHDWLERLPEGSLIFTARGGTQGQLNVFFRGCLVEALEQGYKPSNKDTVETLSFVDLVDLGEEILTSAEDEGFGVEWDTLRVHAYTIDGKPIKSKVIKKDVTDIIDTGSSSIQALTLANIRMSEEIRRVLREITNHNAKNLETIAMLTNSVVNSEKDKIELERENMTRELIMQLHDEDTGEDTRSQGIELLQRIAEGLFSKQTAMNMDDVIKETIKNDPEKVREFMQDPEVVEAIMKEVMKGGDENV